MKIRAIITGSTGMVGEGVLHECLLHPDVEAVLVINRRPCGISHSKLKEIIHSNFFDLSPLKPQLINYNACFFCMGVSSVGMSEDNYRKFTYNITVEFANLLAGPNRDMTFCYVSGTGTDSTEKGKSMWARIKGKTENDLLKLPFKKVYLFRPGYMQPTRGLKKALSWYSALSWLYPALRKMFPKFVCTLKEVGIAMINCAKKDYGKNILEVPDIVEIARD